MLFTRARCASWEIQHIFPARILAGYKVASVSQRWGTELHQILKVHRGFINAPEFMLDIRYVAFFRNWSAQRPSWSQILQFLTSPPVKLGSGWWIVRVKIKFSHDLLRWMLKISDILLGLETTMRQRPCRASSSQGKGKIINNCRDAQTQPIRGMLCTILQFRIFGVILLFPCRARKTPRRSSDCHHQARAGLQRAAAGHCTLCEVGGVELLSGIHDSSQMSLWRCLWERVS